MAYVITQKGTRTCHAKQWPSPPSPFILGNDFADQYSISVIQQEGGCNLEFGDSGRRMVVENLISPPFTDEDGHTFKVRVLKATSFESKRSTHQRNQKFNCRTRFRN